jgi:serine protease Do
MAQRTIIGAVVVVVATAALGAAGLPLSENEAGTSRAQSAVTLPAAQEGEPAPAPRALELLGAREVQIGVSVRDLEGEQANALSGARVDEVRADSPAEKAGLKSGDVVVEFDGEKVRSARHLSRLVSETAPGRTVAAGVVRQGQRVDLRVTPEAGRMAWVGEAFPGAPMRFSVPGLRMDERRFRIDPRAGEEGDRTFEFFVDPPAQGRLGIGAQDMTPDLAEYFGTKGGVLVTRVGPDSPAARAGLKAGDVITSINGQPVQSVAELRREIGRASDQAEVSIGYMRDRKSATATTKLEPRERPRRPARPA